MKFHFNKFLHHFTHIGRYLQVTKTILNYVLNILVKDEDVFNSSAYLTFPKCLIGNAGNVEYLPHLMNSVSEVGEVVNFRSSQVDKRNYKLLGYVRRVINKFMTY